MFVGPETRTENRRIRGNRNARSDIGVAACLGFGALEAALLNVDINLLQTKDRQVLTSIQRERGALVDEARSLKDGTLGVVSRIMADK